MYNQPQIHEDDGIVEGPADDARPVDNVQQVPAVAIIDVEGLWVDGGAGVGGSVLQHVVTREQPLVIDQVRHVALSALAPLRPGAGVPTNPGKADL